MTPARSRTDMAVYAYAAAYAALLLAQPHDPLWRAVSNALYFPMGAIAIAAQVGAFRSASLAARDRRAWGFLAVAYTIFWTTGLSWTMRMSMGLPGEPLRWLDFVAAGLAVVGLLQFPRDARVRWRDPRVRLDAALLAVAWVAMFWQFAVRPALSSADGLQVAWFTGLLTTWPELACAAVVYLMAGEQWRRRAIAFHFAALVVAMIADFLLSELLGRYSPGNWVDLAWFLAWMFRWRAARSAIAVEAAHSAAGTRTPGSGAVKPEAELRSNRGIAPTAFVAGAYVSLVIDVALGRSGGALSLAVAASIMTVLLLLRQRIELADTRALERVSAASAARFRSLIEHADDFVLVVDPLLTVAFASPSAERAGVTRQGEQFLNAVHVDDRQTVRTWLEASGSERRPLRSRVRASDDAWRDAELRAHDRRDDSDVMGWVINGRDVSTETGLQRRLRHSEKLGALHEMAGRVAHAFNNALSAMKGHAELIALELDDDSLWRNDIEQINAAATRGAAITRQLLGFSGTHVIRPVAIDVWRLTRELAPTLERLLPATVTLDLGAPGEQLVVLVDKSQLEQVIVNLVTNARDAMPNGGPVSIRWRANGVDGALLQVQDAGTGISADVLQRVFDPFYTTKPIGQGTGLGLAMVESMVRRAGGQVTIESTVGVGTTVHVHLLRSATDAGAARVPTPRAVPVQMNATVLLVDDEADVRRASRRILERGGYTVLEADGGAAAIAVMRERPSPVDVVVTDMMMPVVSGRDVIDECRRIWPHTPILCLTGFAAVGPDGRALTQDVHQIVEKPFTSAVLTGAVASAIAAARAAAWNPS